MKKFLPLLAALPLVLGLSSFTQASLTVTAFDEILYETTPGLTGLSGKAVFSVSGGILTVVLTNTSTGLSGNDAGNVLTGIGFSLPNGTWIDTASALHDVQKDGASAYVDGAGAVLLGPAVAKTDWGYGDGVGGHFDTPAVFTYNTVLSTFRADVDNNLSNGSGNTVDQFDYGLVSKAGGLGPGGAANNPTIRDTVIVMVKLTGNLTEQEILNYIDSQKIAIAFGSPTLTNGGGEIPEPATLAIWGALGVLGLAARRRNVGARS